MYLLKSKKDDRLYIGYSSDLQRRFKEHCGGLVDATRNRRPVELIYYESYSDEALARERESNLKQFGSAYTGLLKRLKLK